ncbi:MAG: MFS transporter [Ilumatobacter fluminis]|uniref:MFS transporter n=1 Tax=Ilumatobacter fluminis TaxID=467091 RepID=UPI0032F07F13
MRLGRDFDRFWAAATVSNLGDGIRLSALPLLALTLTDDARLIGLVSASSLLPWAVLGPIGGALVDRGDRRTLMISGQVFRAVLVLGLALLVAADQATVLAVIVVALGIGSAEVIVDTSSQSAVPLLVGREQLERANARLITSLIVFDEMIGLALGAVLFAAVAELPFLVDSATFLLGGVLLATVRRPLQGERTRTTTVRTDIVDGIRFLVHHRFLRSMMVTITTSNLAGNMAFGVLVILVVDELDTDPAMYGVVLAVGAVLGLVGALTAPRLTELVGRRRLLGSLQPPLILSYLINAVATSAWMVSVAFGLASFAIACFNVPAQSIRQSVIPEPLLGRVVATWRMFGMSAGPVGAVLGGVIAESAGIRWSYLAAAVLGFVAWLMVLWSLRYLDEALAATNQSEKSSP